MQALENSEPVVKYPVVPTTAMVNEELNDENLWTKLLVNQVWQIKDNNMKEDFKQYVNIMTLQAVCGICTAPNTMICCTVYTKRVRKNNTSTYTNLSLKHCIVKCALYQHYAVFEY